MELSLNGFTYTGVKVYRGQYADGSLALTLEDEHGVITTASVWTGFAPAEGCIWVKNYSENAGLLDALEAAGVLERTGGSVQVGYVWVPEARVLA